MKTKIIELNETEIVFLKTALSQKNDNLTKWYSNNELTTKQYETLTKINKELIQKLNGA